MGAPAAPRIMSVGKVAIFFVLMALAADTAPVPAEEISLYEQQKDMYSSMVGVDDIEPELYEQQTELYTSLLQKMATKAEKEEERIQVKKAENEMKKAEVQAAKKLESTKNDKAATGAVKKEEAADHKGNPGPFSAKVKPLQEATVASHKRTKESIAAENDEKLLKPFKVAAARDKAIAQETKKEDNSIARKDATYRTNQKQTSSNAKKLVKMADEIATSTDHTVVTEVHKTLHTKSKKEEMKEKEYLEAVAEQAEGKSVLPSLSGLENKPGKLGDVYVPTVDTEKKPTAKEAKKGKTEAKHKEAKKGKTEAKNEEAKKGKTEAKNEEAKKGTTEAKNEEAKKGKTEAKKLK